MAQSVINTFDKGLHQDSAFILQPGGTYRNMKNGMLISYDNNHYTVEMTKGNKVLLTLTPIYLEDETTLDSVPMPIGFISFIDKLVVFSTNSESTSGYGEIGVITFTKIGNDFQGVYVPYYNHASLNFTKLHKIEGFSFRENDNIERVYWSDNFNEPRVFDIANPIFTTYYTGSADLTIGTTYMVLIGAVTHNVVDYGPGFVAGNIFTAVGTSYTVLDGSPLVIEYFPMSLLDWVPTRALGNIGFVEYGFGNKNCGNNIYFYRLSSSLDGVQTSWSYASNPIHVGMSNETAYLTGTPYIDFVGNGSSTTLVDSGKSVKIKVSNIDTNFDTIEICCAEFDQKLDIPYSINIVKKEPITSTEMTIEDVGDSNLGTVTISELTLFPASVLKCKTLTTNKNYNIIANIVEREEYELDLSGVTLTSFEHPLISHGDIDLCGNCNVPFDQSPVVGASPGVGDIKPHSRYLVSLAPDASNRVEYPVASGTYYYTGDVITGVAGSTSATFTGTAVAIPCATRNRYTKITPTAFSGNRVEDAIALTTGFWDYKDPTIASHNKGYWSSEKYRFGILFFDKKGNPFYVKWIGDIDMPSVTDKGGLMVDDSYSGGTNWSLNPSGINVSGLDIPETIMNNISGFSIVRAERDAIIIAQGLLMQSVIDNTSVPPSIMPLGMTRTDYSLNQTYEGSDGYYLNSFLSPDDLIRYDFFQDIGEIGQQMKEAFWLQGSDLRTDGASIGGGDYHVMLTKMFALQGGTGKDSDSPRTLTLQPMNGVGSVNLNENGSSSNIAGSGYNYLNFFSPIAPASVIAGVDYTCSNLPIWSFDPILSVGCRKRIIKTQFHHFGPTADDYNTWTNNANYAKMVANFITDKDPSTQYGGTSAVAKADTLYMSTGHFQPIDATVKANTLNGTFASGIYSGDNKYTFNDIEIFGGDCFTNLVDLGYGLWKETWNVAGLNAMSYALWFPCEGNANYGLRRGLKVSNRDMSPMGLMAWENGSGNAVLESYSYNQGYSSDGIFIKYPALPNNYKFTGKFEYRMRWSKLKYPGELINSFRTFAIPDYRDVDGQRGQINNLKARDSKLFYWQDHSVGYTPILERQLIGGSALGDATALGVTGVIDRYDDIDTNFGNQHQHGLTETEYGFAWFDMRRRAFMVMGIGSKPEEMSMIKGMQVFFNNQFNEGNVGYPGQGGAIYNTNNLDVSEIPLMGYGIVGCYDPIFKMTYLTFKYDEYNLAAGPIETRVSRDFTLGYNHVLNAFVSFFDNCPAIWHNHNDLVLTANNGKFTKPYNIFMPSTDFVIGDTVSENGIEYICIKDVTITSYPGAATKIPSYPSSIYWLAINTQNEIYLQNFGADLCKFYGKLWSHEIEVVVNAKSDVAVSPQNIQFKTVGPNWTDIECSTEDQTSQDQNISATNRNYRWIDKSWFSSLPLPTNGRLTDYYVKIKFTFKNYVTSPTTAKNTQKISQWLKTMFVGKR